MPRAIFTFLAIFLFAASGTAWSAEKAPRVLPYSSGQISGWQAVVSDYSFAPSFLIAVDKKGQQVSLFERKSPLTKIAEYICTTGQKEGDKLVEGDLKTPEGVYFVVNHINKGLNYALYGYEAYPLNYPNPVDRLRKKTGSGIWIHGKGIPLVPYDSEGCVGMFNQDIATFREKPIIGQPVTLAVNVVYQDKADQKRAETAATLAAKVEAWAKAWSERSSEMFDYYDSESYSIAQGQSFKTFKAQKEHLFKTLPWINTKVSDIQVLEGPGYWVTWFNQEYAAPNLTSRGTRRLYWQEDAEGELRIVGMEWLNGLQSPVLYAENKSSNTQTDAAPNGKPEPQTVAQAPEFKPVTPKATDKPGAEKAASAAKPAASATAKTAESDKTVADAQVAAKPLPAKAPVSKPAQVESAKAAPAASETPAALAQAKPVVDSKPIAIAEAKPALEAKPLVVAEAKPSVVQAKPVAEPAGKTQASEPAKPVQEARPAPVSREKLLESERARAKAQNPSVAQADLAEAKPAPGNHESLLESALANAAAKKSAEERNEQSREFIQNWQAAWKAQDLAAYSKFYADNARQDNRSGLQAILTQKNNVWQKSRVIRLDFSNVSIDTTASGLKIVMQQDYADSRGYADKGVKILYLEFQDGWRIVREDWKPLVVQ